MIGALLGFIKRILGLIGSTDDAAGTPTIFGRLKLIGTNSDAAGTSTVFARLKQIYDNMLLRTTWTNARAGYLDKLNAGGIPGTVKRVQYGSYASAYDGESYITIPISAVVRDRSILLLDGSTAIYVEGANPSTSDIVSTIVVTPVRGTINNDGTALIIKVTPPTLFGASFYASNTLVEFHWQVAEHY